MNRYIIIVSMALLCWCRAVACGGGWITDYYLFSVFPHSQMSGVNTEAMYQFWSDYTGKEYCKWAVDEIGTISPDEFATTDNDIVAAARSKSDTEMLQYLQLLNNYLQLTSRSEDDEWDYPTKADKANAKQQLEYINHRARTYSGTRLSQQYLLLQMRTLMAMGNFKGASTLWESVIAKQQSSVYRDIARGLYAAAQLQLGNRSTALAEYEQMGDMQSVKWIVRKRRNYNGIKQEYDLNPNSPTLTFLVQDFVNNAYSTSCRSPEEMKWIEPTSIYQDQIDRFCELAQQAVNNKAVNNPCLWQSALGYLQALTGHADQAVKTLENAMKMRGTQRMLDNAHVCFIFARIKAADGNALPYRNFLAKELKWVEQMDKNAGEMDMHYNEVLMTLMHEYLAPQFVQWNDKFTSIGIEGLLPTIGDFFYNDEIDKLTSQELLNYRAYLCGKAGSDLDAWIQEVNTPMMSDESFNDRMGTCLIREGRYADAIPYLEKVTIPFIAEQAINTYMSRRTYLKDRWFDHQVVEYFDESKQLPAGKTTNQKLNYCRDMVSLQQQYADNPAPETAYKLASMYYQASYEGDCWYLSRYGWSRYDTVCYNGEENKVEITVELLRRVKAETNDFNLLQKATYALATIPYGPPAVTTTFTDNYDIVYHLNENSYQYQTMCDLKSLYMRNRGSVASYISHCDILKEFIKDPVSLPEL